MCVLIDIADPELIECDPQYFPVRFVMNRVSLYSVNSAIRGLQNRLFSDQYIIRMANFSILTAPLIHLVLFPFFFWSLFWFGFRDEERDLLRPEESRDGNVF